MGAVGRLRIAAGGRDGASCSNFWITRNSAANADCKCSALSFNSRRSSSVVGRGNGMTQLSRATHGKNSPDFPAYFTPHAMKSDASGCFSVRDYQTCQYLLQERSTGNVPIGANNPPDARAIIRRLPPSLV